MAGMRAWLLVFAVAGCGDQVSPTPEERFVEAACQHAGCKGWATDFDTCAFSFRMAMTQLGAQDAACLEAATATLERTGCGDETNTAADGVVGGKCKR